MADYSRLRNTLSDYEDPTFEEMLRLCQDFGLIADYHASLQGVRIRCVNQVFELTVDEAEILMQGLLLGFFYGHSRDDLTLAKWKH